MFKVFFIEAGVTKLFSSYKWRKVAEDRVKTLSDLPWIERAWIEA